jgi:hypothetical protein
VILNVGAQGGRRISIPLHHQENRRRNTRIGIRKVIHGSGMAIRKREDGGNIE